MTSEILTVDAAANLLHLHPKTVLRFIREGRLRATKIGKQYRIIRSDVNAFAGADKAERMHAAKATTIVDIDDVDHVLLERVSALLLGASKRNQQSETSITINMAHDPVHGSLKIVIIASPADAAALLQLADSCLESRAN